MVSAGRDTGKTDAKARTQGAARPTAAQLDWRTPGLHRRWLAGFSFRLYSDRFDAVFGFYIRALERHKKKVKYQKALDDLLTTYPLSFYSFGLRYEVY